MTGSGLTSSSQAHSSSDSMRPGSSFTEAWPVRSAPRLEVTSKRRSMKSTTRFVLCVMRRWVSIPQKTLLHNRDPEAVVKVRPRRYHPAGMGRTGIQTTRTCGILHLLTETVDEDPIANALGREYSTVGTGRGGSTVLAMATQPAPRDAPVGIPSTNAPSHVELGRDPDPGRRFPLDPGSEGYWPSRFAWVGPVEWRSVITRTRRASRASVLGVRPLQAVGEHRGCGHAGGDHLRVDVW